MIPATIAYLDPVLGHRLSQVFISHSIHNILDTILYT